MAPFFVTYIHYILPATLFLNPLTFFTDNNIFYWVSCDSAHCSTCTISIFLMAPLGNGHSI